MTARAMPFPGKSEPASNSDLVFAAGIAVILSVLFLPVPALLIDAGFAISIALAVLILMVALWIQKPLDFSAFPTVLLIATLMRLSLNIASTRLILSQGAEGTNAAGYVIGGFSKLVMSGDFVIGLIVFAILVTVNFVVITKGATRIAEVGARFTLDSMPGKQMAIDADLAAGIIDDKEAQRRRREIEEESGFFGAMDGASKFVRGDAIAGLIITGVNVCGGIAIGVFRHGLPVSEAADVYVKLSVGDGLVTQIPALIVSLAAGLLVSKGGNRGSADKAILGQLGAYPKALTVAALLMFTLALVPGLPLIHFAVLGAVLIGIGRAIPKRVAATRAFKEALAAEESQRVERERRDSIRETLRVSEIELLLGKQISAAMLGSHNELQHRVKKMRQKFARQFGFVLPEIVVTDDLSLPPKSYDVRINGTRTSSGSLRSNEVMVIVAGGPVPQVPHEPAVEPAFGLKAVWVSEVFSERLRREGFEPVNGMTVLLTHLSETLKQNLHQLFSYKHMRALIDRLDPEYKKLVEEICPAQINMSSLQAVFKQLLAERVSIRNVHTILEAIAEVVPFSRRIERIAEHVRVRIGQQICSDLQDAGALKILRLGGAWDDAFHRALRRDAKGEVTEFDMDPREIERFGREANTRISELMQSGERFVLVTHGEVRPFVRMVVDRLCPSLPVLSHLEIARCADIHNLGTVS